MTMFKRDSAATPLYRRIVTDAWRIAWVHKHLWLFGFFATFLSFGGVSEVLVGIYDQTSGARPDSIHLGTLGVLPGIAALRGVVALSPYPALSVVIFLAILLLFIGVFAFVVSTAIGGLIHGIQKVERGGEPTFGEGMKAGGETVVPVFSANLLSKAIIALAFILTSANLVTFLSHETIVSRMFFVGSFVAFTAIALMAAVTAVYATNAIVIDKMPFEKAWPAAWRVMKNNWLVSLEMVLIMTLAGIVVGIIALLGAMILSIPLIFFFFLAAVIQNVVFMALMMSVTTAALLVLIILVGSFMTTFQVAAWFLLWKELTGKPPVPHIVRLINGFRAKHR